MTSYDRSKGKDSVKKSKAKKKSTSREHVKTEVGPPTKTKKEKSMKKKHRRDSLHSADGLLSVTHNQKIYEANKKNPRLSSLPEEIRDEIAMYAQHVDIDVSPDILNVKTVQSASFLRVCRQLHEEWQLLFYHHAIASAKKAEHLVQWAHSLKPEFRAQIQHMRLVIDVTWTVQGTLDDLVIYPDQWLELAPDFGEISNLKTIYVQFEVSNMFFAKFPDLDKKEVFTADSNMASSESKVINTVAKAEEELKTAEMEVTRFLRTYKTDLGVVATHEFKALHLEEGGLWKRVLRDVTRGIYASGDACESMKVGSTELGDFKVTPRSPVEPAAMFLHRVIGRRVTILSYANLVCLAYTIRPSPDDTNNIPTLEEGDRTGATFNPDSKANKTDYFHDHVII
ncbi:hypothetical protein IQ06DRAFT_307487 [Phaeosphaeriaceae sp. SRC1lsM3a]|nr:hypothetical protein IQ06DRAFT_307487 [Stagonospora sp. SRC1lsM3a]